MDALASRLIPEEQYFDAEEGQPDEDIWHDIQAENPDDDEDFQDPQSRTSHFAHFRQNDSINCTLVNRSRLCNEMACYIMFIIYDHCCMMLPPNMTSVHCRFCIANQRQWLLQDFCMEGQRRGR
jgi:hypothetical protein